MRMQLGYGAGKVEVELPDAQVLAVLKANSCAVQAAGPQLVRQALERPIGDVRLRDKVRPGQKVAIVTSDITRPCPSHLILPCILEELAAAGVRDGDITIVFVLGSHRRHTQAEMRRLVSDAVFSRIRCFDLDTNNCVPMGITSRGTPVAVFRPVAEADFRICVGNIEYHYFAGYSGGAKAIMPGVCTRAAIQTNHSRMVLPAACAGRLEGNPVREDIDEAAQICRVDYLVNVVLDDHREIVCAVCGDVYQAHRAGCRFLDTLYKVRIPRRADIVLVTPGGWPKDANMYQAQKALDNAAHAVKDGGTIIWLAACTEGLGSDVFSAWMTGHRTPGDMIRHIRVDFQLGGHKAAAIAMVLQRAHVVLVSELEDDFVRSIHLMPASDVRSALDAALARYGSRADIIVMPHGGSTLPVTEPR